MKKTLPIFSMKIGQIQPKITKFHGIISGSINAPLTSSFPSPSSIPTQLTFPGASSPSWLAHRHPPPTHSQNF